MMVFGAPGYMTSSFGWAPPLPCLLHCLIFLATPVWELFPVGNQYDNIIEALKHGFDFPITTSNIV